MTLTLADPLFLLHVSFWGSLLEENLTLVTPKLSTTFKKEPQPQLDCKTISFGKLSGNSKSILPPCSQLLTRKLKNFKLDSFLKNNPIIRWNVTHDFDQAAEEYKEIFMPQILQTLQSYALFCINAIQGAQNKWMLPKLWLIIGVYLCVLGVGVRAKGHSLSKHSFQRTKNEAYFEGSRL